MCTVTFVPLNSSDFVLTSNRDEAPNRETDPPIIYNFENSKVLFPKDKLAGGSWIGVSEKSRTLCILNGGFTIHERQDRYIKSRGVVVKDLLICDDLTVTIKDYDLYGIEPFTLVIIDHENELKLLQLIWDGEQKHFEQLPLIPKLWSSSSLYSKEMKIERQRWFNDFASENNLNAEALLRFHRNAGKGNLEYGVVMDRFFVKTTSITQIEKHYSEVKMKFIDLTNQSEFETTFNAIPNTNE